MTTVGNSVSAHAAASAASAGSATTGAAPRTAIVRLFGVDITDTTLPVAADMLVARARHGLSTTVGFLNAHCVNVMARSSDYRSALGGLDMVFADGIGVRLAARSAGIELADNVNGTDLFPVLCGAAARADVGLYLFGAREGIAKAAGEAMQQRNPGLVIAGSHHGYVQGEDAEAQVIAHINGSGAGILLVALGVPAQELWIARNRHRITVPVILGVGGLYDYYSGRIPRAPLAVRKAGFEWAWRLAMEPRRLFTRYCIGNAAYLARLAYARLAAPADFRSLPAA